MTDLQSRGMKDTLFMCSNNLTGLQQAVQATFPNSVHQICIVHQIRNTLKFITYKDRKAIIADIKAIYQASNEKVRREKHLKLSRQIGTKNMLSL